MLINNSAVLLINKPYKWTSFDVIGKLRGLLKYHFGKDYKVGHAGTLDPLATGLLIVCVGRETKNIDKYQGMEKEYTGTFFLGATTPCFDKEQAVDKVFPVDHISPEMIYAAAKELSGTYKQMPPVFSAKKIDGKRAYELARAGKEVLVQPKEITISVFEITGIELPLVSFRIVCSKGTYVRSLARDFGVKLGSGAYLDSLCRTRIGPFLLGDARELENIEKELKPLFSKQDIQKK